MSEATPEGVQVWIDEFLTNVKAEDYLHEILAKDDVELSGHHNSTPASVLHGHFLALVREMSGPVFLEGTEFTGANRAARRRNSKVNKASYMRMLPGRF